ncbi:glycosyltransferase [Nakamurella deserti]|uniref:glycosyltransferase n=1 Tax=Nakamurella deserti TaxID=2164074 RepID=UPI001F0B8AE7|nr:glycosyltransferase [Nakamurella deserti]
MSFAHVYRLTDDVGLFEHAEFTRPREEHAYCVDDVSRGLVAIAREDAPDARLLALGELYLQFVLDAQAPDGRFANRRALDRHWEDEPSVEDCWGRALWSLGTAAARLPLSADRALAAFDRGATLRSEYPRAMAFAGLGAAEVLAVHPDHAGARALLADSVASVGVPGDDPRWCWPEDRLRYANAALAEVLLLAGARLDDAAALDRGLAMLGWLFDVESVQGHLSITPVDGWSLGEPRPAFDQQPIEVAALADACATAFSLTGDHRWADGVRLCAAWFLGYNDAAVALHDPVSGGGCDGLLVYGRNENQGAESTLALLSTLQQAHRMPASR